MPRDSFPRVREAREALRAKALEILAKYEKIIDAALLNGDYETAAEHTRWLVEHMPHEDGERMIDSSAAKGQISEGTKGPNIQIGIQMGGIQKPKALAAKVIDVVPEEKDE